MDFRTCARAAVYQRVSTDRQFTENQRPELLQLAKARGLEVVETYEETASAAKQRDAFDAMMRHAHAGRFDTLLVWSLDRFGRSMTGNLNAVLELDRLGVRVVSVREPWLDTSGPVRALLVAIFGWVAEQERTRLIERTRAGVARARREGKTLGRPAAKVDLDEVRVLVEVRGMSLRKAAKQLGVSAATLHKVLKASRAQCSQSGGAKVSPEGAQVIGFPRGRAA
jgi:DNA invertase Pin-like site-specific DNA recombinase